MTQDSLLRVVNGASSRTNMPFTVLFGVARTDFTPIEFEPVNFSFLQSGLKIQRQPLGSQSSIPFFLNDVFQCIVSRLADSNSFFHSFSKIYSSQIFCVGQLSLSTTRSGYLRRMSLSLLSTPPVHPQFQRRNYFTATRKLGVLATNFGRERVYTSSISVSHFSEFTQVHFSDRLNSFIFSGANVHSTGVPHHFKSQSHSGSAVYFPQQVMGYKMLPRSKVHQIRRSIVTSHRPRNNMMPFRYHRLLSVSSRIH